MISTGVLAAGKPGQACPRKWDTKKLLVGGIDD
jgi:hypothetical protein